MGNLDGRIELDEVLLKAQNNTKQFIAQLEHEEAGERIETLDSLQNQIKADRGNTNRKKLQFIDEMKGELGKQIKDKNVKGVVIRQDTFRDKVKKFFVALFSKF